ncbi:MAG: hypothetical protein LBS62_04560, partial [Clostridiales bacterium]|nr:hypothetical protein [Clostridiales bacterium]
ILRREKKCTFHAGCWLLTHENTERFLEDVFVCEYNGALSVGGENSGRESYTHNTCTNRFLILIWNYNYSFFLGGKIF